MRDSFINLSRIAWLSGTAILVMIANVAISIFYMLVYGHLINPGHEKEFYDNHIQIAAPYCSIIAGIPLMFLAGWLISSWWEGRFRTEAALAVWGVYALIDIAVALMAGVTMRTAGLVAISLLTKLGAVYLGAVVGGRRSEM